ncbi:hypothetical protein BKA70DRAFT_1103985, partial [Coprinopsis sp. MPI-PUGE-AT-0042]
GMPFSTAFISPTLPSRQIAASLSVRKLWIHLRYTSGTLFLRSSQRRRWWLTKSKYPLMSNVRDDVAYP